jgi:hypothetical protein
VIAAPLFVLAVGLAAPGPEAFVVRAERPQASRSALRWTLAAPIGRHAEAAALERAWNGCLADDTVALGLRVEASPDGVVLSGTSRPEEVVAALERAAACLPRDLTTDAADPRAELGWALRRPTPRPEPLRVERLRRAPWALGVVGPTPPDRASLIGAIASARDDGADILSSTRSATSSGPLVVLDHPGATRARLRIGVWLAPGDHPEHARAALGRACDGAVLERRGRWLEASRELDTEVLPELVTRWTTAWQTVAKPTSPPPGEDARARVRRASAAGWLEDEVDALAFGWTGVRAPSARPWRVSVVVDADGPILAALAGAVGPRGVALWGVSTR